MTQAPPRSSTVKPTPRTESRPIWTADDLRENPHAVHDKPQRVRAMFGAIASSYDLNNRLHSLGCDQAWRRRAVRLCSPVEGLDVLDVACGTGDLAQAFADAGARSVTGVDFTEAMLEVARAKALRRRAGSAMRAATPAYVHGDALDLPFADASFGIVSIAFGIRNVADPVAALREFHRVLQPGGRLLVLEFSQPRHRLVRWFHNLYCGRIMPFTATLIAADRSGAYLYLPRSVATFPSGTVFARLIESCGFARVELHPMTLGICTAYVAVR